MNKLVSLFIATVLCGSFAAHAEIQSPEQERPKIQVALLLDTSSSMDGMINQARAELWNVVNAFATAKRDGRAPILEIALFEYGNDRLTAQSGYIRQVTGFTRDLDSVSQRLFELKTLGGSEYCGWVIGDAVKRLEWSRSDSDLRAIFIAGNEPFTQGPVPFAASVERAVGKHIIVNTIHCGSEQEGALSGWKEGARLGHGAYAFIDQNRVVATIPAPQDAELARLSQALNRTYLPFGAEGARGALNQTAQDQNALQLSMGTSSTRAFTKSSGYYRNSTWDLVDAVHDKNVVLAKVAADQLPAAMRTMDLAAREAYVKQKTAEREELQGRIRKLAREREEFLASARKTRALQRPDTLGDALLAAARTEAQQSGFTLGE